MDPVVAAGLAAEAVAAVQDALETQHTEFVQSLDASILRIVMASQDWQIVEDDLLAAVARGVGSN